MSDVIRVSIGTEPKQYIPGEVLKSSILRRATRPVVFSESWTKSGGWNKAIADLPKLRPGTAFSGWRWIVPTLYGWRGKAIYLDADQVVLGDIGDLWDALEEGKSFAAVCNAEGFFGKKVPEPGAVQTSVMVMDCDRCRWSPLKLFHDVETGKLKYKDLMQARFLDREEIQEIDPSWNHFGMRDERTKLLHWSHVASQPYRKPTGHPTAYVFEDELHHAIRVGLISPATVRAEIMAGNLCTTWEEGLPAREKLHPDSPENVGGLPADSVLRSEFP